MGIKVNAERKLASCPSLANTFVFVSLLAVAGKENLIQTCDALRMINLDAPETALQGDTIQLSCFFSLRTADVKFENQHQHRQQSLQSAEKSARKLSAFERRGEFDESSSKFKRAESDEFVHNLTNDKELLYAIKWYKDEREFFRYLAQEWPHKQALPADGLQVDVDKSDNYTVVLRNLSLKSSGLIRCEVSTDAPSFVTKSMERKLIVYSLPNEGPKIGLASSKLDRTASGPKEVLCAPGDTVELSCVASESKPAASIDWIINDSLNLSAMMPLDNRSRPLFESYSRRTVKLPSIRSQPTANTESSRQTYELLDGDLAVVAPESNAGSDSSPIAINLSRALDHLIELTTSRLNFTINAKLIQTLASLQAAATTNSTAQPARLSGQNRSSSAEPIQGSQEDRARNRTQTTDERSNSIKRNGALSSLLYEPHDDVSRSMRKKTSLVPKPQHSGDKDKMQLRVKCVARVLHMRMSDEIKLRLAIDNPWRSHSEQTEFRGDSWRRQKSQRNHAGEFSRANRLFVTPQFDLSNNNGDCLLFRHGTESNTSLGSWTSIIMPIIVVLESIISTCSCQHRRQIL